MFVRPAMWVAENALNGVAYASLALSPPRAIAWLRRLASPYPTIASFAEARSALRRLGNRGSCLSRSLSLAIRYPGSQVVIGVARTQSAGVKGNPSGPSSIGAHAWVEIGGIALAEGDNVRWREIARLDVGRGSPCAG